MRRLFRRRRRETSGPYWRQRGWLVSAAFALLVPVLAGVSYVASDEPPADPVAVTRVVSEPCRDRRPGPDTLPTKAPRDVRWVRHDAALVPVSSSAGPLSATGAVWTCFARTPMGAVLAAHNTPSHMSGGNWRAATASLVVAGPEREAFTAKRARVPNTNARSGKYAGFAVPAYSSDAATVRLLIRHTQGALFSTEITQRWSDGDWKVRPGRDGALHSALRQETSTTGFIMWGA